MVKLLLHDFRHDHNDHDYFNLLKNNFKIESERVLKHWQCMDEYLKIFKNRNKKFKQYESIKKEFLENEYVVMKILKFIRHSKVYNEIPQRLRDKFPVALKGVSEYGKFYSLCNEELKKDRRICLAAVKSSPTIYHELPEEFKIDREFVLMGLRGKLFIEIPEQVCSDTEIIKLLVMRVDLTSVVSKIAKELLDNEEIALKAIMKSPKSVKYISKRLQYDHIFFLSAVKCNLFSLREFPEEMRENRDLIKTLVSNNTPLFVLSDKFKKDKEIIEICLSKRFNDIRYAHESLLIKKEIISFVKNTFYIPSDAFRSIPKHFILDMDVAREIFKRNGSTYSYLNNTYKTREMTECFLSTDATTYIATCLPRDLLEDRELVIRCIKKAEYVHVLPEKYKNDKEAVLLGLQKAMNISTILLSIYLPQFIGKKLKQDEKVVKELLEQFPQFEKYILE